MVNLSKASFSINNPIPQDIMADCRKCADIIDHFIKPEKGQPVDKVLPVAVLQNAMGVAILTVIKAGFIFSGRGGSGLVVAKLPDGSWSAPSAIGTAGMGVGGQIGAEVTDFVIVLNTKEAVDAFSLGGNVTLGGALSVAAGPWGRSAEAGAAVGKMAPIYSYSKSKGLFAGVSIEGSVIVERKDTNAKFYNRTISAKEILSGSVDPPRVADVLYRALNRRIEAAEQYAIAHPQMDPEPSQISNRYSAPPPYQAPISPVSQTSSSLSRENVNSNKPKRPPPPVPNRKQPIAIALYDFVGSLETDLSFKEGDRITVTQSSGENDWWKGILNGKSGDFPGNYVRLQ
ncbi:hypothetical protein EDD86DRAFT_197827 [Gorgonomyces haynaldii]|nr:hypothetical protein EDD86DRAFT_197827 [Gorgonomyces haynaldii]